MLKKILLTIATLGLTASAVPAEAKPQVDFQVTVGNHDNRNWRENRNLRGYYNHRRHYNRIPRCNRWEIAIRNPYRPHRWICVEREHYNTYWRSYQVEPY